MIRKILTYYAGRLDEYLGRTHRQPEGLATVGLIGTAAEETPNKLVVSLVNLEKEATGDSVYMRSTSGNYAGTLAPLLLNMHIMLAAVYESKRYAESLSVLSDTLEFIQSMPRFETEGHRYTVELVPMSTRRWAGSIILRSSARYAGWSSTRARSYRAARRRRETK